jgi:LysM repeat protein
MQWRDFGNALVVALISVGLMIGALSISLVEFSPQVTPTAMNNVPPSPAPLTATPTLIPSLTPTLGLESPTPSVTPTLTNTATPPASCQPPAGWGQIIIQAGDTLDSIAVRYRISADSLRLANCLLIDNLVAGTILYAPPVATTTPVICIPGAIGWAKNYMVRPGDTVYAIATNHYTSAGVLRAVNCRIGDLIFPGEMLWVPNVATRTPYPTPMPGNTVIPTTRPTEPLPFTETALPYTITVVPSNTPVPATSTAIPTLTAVPATFTAIPTLTASPTAFPTP